MIGVADRGLMELVARSAAMLGVRRALIVHSHDGLDELTPTSVTAAIEVRGRKVGKVSSFSRGISGSGARASRILPAAAPGRTRTNCSRFSRGTGEHSATRWFTGAAPFAGLRAAQGI